MTRADSVRKERPVSPFVRGRDEGDRFNMFGGLTFIKATGEETGGAYGLIEQRADAGMATPLHVHRAEDELWFVIDGRISVHVDGETVTVGPGDVAFGPRGLPHAFRVDEDASRYLIVRNAGGESFFEAVGDPADDLTLPDPRPTEAQLERLEEVLETYELDLLGPPPFDD
ncbi:Cupin domain-containing protein [Halobiforma haloterrestris]|uniref:Cupin domain-containing protein n=1 Tax=Natronobacterium haloterrestre TaxID=148448 RepID=A0A1I1D4B5_NATHA|nr:quercetin 2,3-dioxygenase [Halobiforma haloterrestris]SFB67928.1 Cupin domain-containing protein [Halobiforma haloterrestris]